MFKSKIQGNPDSALNCKRRNFNNKPFLYRMKICLWVAILFKVLKLESFACQILTVNNLKCNASEADEV